MGIDAISASASANANDSAAPVVVRIEVLYCPGPHEHWRWQGELPAASTVADALDCCGIRAACPTIDWAGIAIGVWGRIVALERPLRDGDRIELYRPLKLDPKEARRQRVDRSGASARRRGRVRAFTCSRTR